MLVFAAICPHSPVLIPTIGKENTLLFAKTLEAYKSLKIRLTEANPEVLVVLTPHNEISGDKFIIPSATEFQVSFEDFGDLATKFKIPAQNTLANHWRESFKKELKFKIIQAENLDFGAGVPLFYLNKEHPIPVIVIGQADLDRDKHWRLGELLAEEFSTIETRIGVIASGELSHCLSESAPGGYVASAKTFDNKIVEFLNQKKNTEILNLKESEVLEIKECGLKTITTLLGVLNSSRFEPEFLAYEAPLGVGCLTMNFKLNY